MTSVFDIFIKLCYVYVIKVEYLYLHSEGDKHMDIRVLRYFVTVADERSFTKAAERLHMSQPPLSKQIKLLENDLGVCLFDRTTRVLYLTREGEILYKRAKKIISQMDDIETFFTDFRRGEIGSFLLLDKISHIKGVYEDVAPDCFFLDHRR